MENDHLRSNIHQIIPPRELNSWEEDELVEHLSQLAPDAQEATFKQIQAIWPVSHSLCLSFLHNVREGLNCIPLHKLNHWVNSILEVYESEGLHKANHFMSDVNKNYVCKIRGETGLPLLEVKTTLTHYLRAISGRNIDIIASDNTYTDGMAIYLPHKIKTFKEQRKNFLAYKYAATFQWAYLAFGTFKISPEQFRTLVSKPNLFSSHKTTAISNLDDFFSLFADTELARDIFLLAEITRIKHPLADEFPGLINEVHDILPVLAMERAKYGQRKNIIIDLLIDWIFDNKTASYEKKIINKSFSIFKRLQDATKNALDSAAATIDLYSLIAAVDGTYTPIDQLPIYGHLRPLEYEKALQKKQDTLKQMFVKAVKVVLPKKVKEEQVADAFQNMLSQRPKIGETDTTLLLAPKGNESANKNEHHDSDHFLFIANESFELPDNAKQILNEARNKYGGVSDEFIRSSLGTAGHGSTSMLVPHIPETEFGPLSGPLVYDEWDHRRNGFRKNWCSLLEKDLLPVRGSFVNNTLTKHRGIMLQIKNRFEIMRTQEHVARRQRDGDDIDLDATIESLADMKANLSPSEKLFTRLVRNQRNIATIFLVDMSSSTEGWISTAIKESLILMCEALEILGDRYGIYGFSGMRRLRTEMYHIKHLHEKYDEEVKGKIAAITPKEYTRMGPPIRHASKLLQEVEAKVRLLITLSDGKPEDYDDYKGKYAIEDTRHALIEAKHMGIHPFCITIDQHAHDYISHMYGEINYTFIDDIKKLPVRMPEIYRTLTT